VQQKCHCDVSDSTETFWIWLEVKGLGAVFVHFADTAGSSKAFKMMNGRTFDGVKIEASYISEATYNNKDF